jgi:hypothetical protein
MADSMGDAVGKLAFAVAFTLLLVGLPVGVAVVLAETTGSSWAALLSLAVTINVSFFLHLWVVGSELEAMGPVMLGVGIAVVGALWALVGFHVIAGRWESWGSGGTGGVVSGLIGLVAAVVGMVLTVFGVHRSLSARWRAGRGDW